MDNPAHRVGEFVIAQGNRVVGKSCSVFRFRADARILVLESLIFVHDCESPIVAPIEGQAPPSSHCSGGFS